MATVQCDRSLYRKADCICLAKACCCFCRQMEMKKDHKDEPGQEQLEEMPGTLPHFSLAILLLYGMNTGLSKLTHALDIQFPSALIGSHLSLHCNTAADTDSSMPYLCATGSDNAYVMRNVHCGSHAHRTIANACCCAAGSCCRSDRLA